VSAGSPLRSPRGRPPRPLWGPTPVPFGTGTRGPGRPLRTPAGNRGAPARGVDVKPPPGTGSGEAPGGRKRQKTAKNAQNGLFWRFWPFWPKTGLFAGSGTPPRGVDVKPPSPGPAPGSRGPGGSPDGVPDPSRGPGGLPEALQALPGGPGSPPGPPGAGVLHQPLAPGPRGSGGPGPGDRVPLLRRRGWG